MGRPFAELVGDPVSHSLSPAIHRYWLEELGLPGDYRSARVAAGGLAAYFEARRRDPFWRGCNVTAPLKREAAALLGDPTGVCAWLGAVNCVFRSPLGAVPANTDLAGIAEALAGARLRGAKACLIGTGGAAAAALCHLVREEAGSVSILSRDKKKAAALARLVPASSPTRLAPEPYENAPAAMAGAALIIHATPMGMTGGPQVPPEIEEALAAEAAPDTMFFEMVYAPVETRLLAIARERGARCIDGLAMLIGQAAPAFAFFFGAAAPRERDSELRERLSR
jgi:shikimate dehydrogenase